MATTKESLIEVKDGVSYELSAVKTGKPSKCVGLAPARMLQGDTPDNQLEDAIKTYGSEYICKQLRRMNTIDAANAVRAKYNRDKVSASAVLKAIGAGELSPEDIQAATDDMKAGKGTFTDLCAARLGVGEDALKNADPSHIHWDCAK